MTILNKLTRNPSTDHGQTQHGSIDKLLRRNHSDQNSYRGFTLLEMMTVIALIGVLASLVTLRLDIFGRDADRELRRFESFVKKLHSESIEQGISRKTRFLPAQNTIRVQKDRTFRFQEWTIDHDEKFELLLTPVGALGVDTIQLERNDRTVTFQRQRLSGVARGENNSEE